jgi:hypothetical protein
LGFCSSAFIGSEHNQVSFRKEDLPFREKQHVLISACQSSPLPIHELISLQRPSQSINQSIDRLAYLNSSYPRYSLIHRTILQDLHNRPQINNAPGSTYLLLFYRQGPRQGYRFSSLFLRRRPKISPRTIPQNVYLALRNVPRLRTSNHGLPHGRF